jgi:hypothetical protein
MSISCTFPIQKMSFWEKAHDPVEIVVPFPLGHGPTLVRKHVFFEANKRYQPAKITVWERVPLGIRASTREPVPVRCQILQHQCPGRC